MPIEIRRADLQDSAALAELLKQLSWFADLAAESTQATETRVEQHLSLGLADSSHSIYVAVSKKQPEKTPEAKSELVEEAIVGYIAVHWLPYLFLTGPEGFISELFVRSTHRGQGIGTQLLNGVQTEATTRGCARLMLVSDRQRDSYQRGYYSNRGWQERASIANFVYPLPQSANKLNLDVKLEP